MTVEAAVSEATARRSCADAVGFDFAAKVCGPIEVGTVRGEIDRGRFVWIDVDSADAAEARALIGGLGLVGDPTLDDLFGKEPASQVFRYENYLHLVIASCRLDPSSALHLERIDAVIGEHFLLTVHEGARPVIDGVKRDYRADFLRFAKTPSFLVYELWDHLGEHYMNVQKQLERRVEQLQVALLRDVDDVVFEKVSEIGVALLHFRSVLIPARAVLTELSTRRTIFISEATQPFLANMVGTLERVLQDLLVDRDSLAQSLNLTMSMVSHRTSRAMTKLTVLSTIFLPLTFLCGVYGMNFEYLPELHWEWGYFMFWCICASIVLGAFWLIRRKRLF